MVIIAGQLGLQIKQFYKSNRLTNSISLQIEFRWGPAALLLRWTNARRRSTSTFDHDFYLMTSDHLYLQPTSALRIIYPG